jgi:predicted secreted protein
MILQDSKFALISTAIILTVLLGAGCIGSGQQHPSTSAEAVQCTESLLLGQNMTTNETQDGATICAQPNSTLTLELPDASRVGAGWSVTASAGLSVSDERTTWIEDNGTATTMIPGLGQGIDIWTVTATNSGVQSLQAILQNPAVGRIGPMQTFNLTIVVE